MKWICGCCDRGYPRRPKDGECPRCGDRLIDVRPTSHQRIAAVIERQSARIEELERLPELIPTNWLDELLTGPRKVLPAAGATITPRDVERLLLAIRDRLETVVRRGGAERRYSSSSGDPHSGSS